MRRQSGRYIVGDKLFPVKGAALAYAQVSTHKDGITRYVREIGKQGSLYVVQKTGTRTTSQEEGQSQ